MKDDVSMPSESTVEAMIVVDKVFMFTIASRWPS